jgi:hypothetical protein
MPRATALYTILGITAVMLAVFTIVSYIARKTHAPDVLSWALLSFFYLVIGFVYAGNNSLVHYNLDGHASGIDFWTVLIPVSVMALAAIVLGSKRGVTLPAADVFAEETHGSRVWSLLFVVLLLAQVVTAIAIPTPPVPIVSALLGLLFAVIALHIWAGFQYVFTGAGVEIRTLGFRLRSIPREDIRHYTVESWNPLRGYGIRGIGNRRAYVWCNRGVRITTTEGEVFLGHNEPERLVRDLDSITLNQPRR